MKSALATDASDRVVVRSLLERALSFPWKLQELGLLSLRLDESKEHALHVWAPGRFVGVPPIHDHPYDFTSTIIVGELTNARYTEDPSGQLYVRQRYSLPDESARQRDHVRLVREAETFGEGDEYHQLAEGLHDSTQLPGTVTLLRRRFKPDGVLTVCQPEGAPWVSGSSRLATPEEITAITDEALRWF